MRGKVILSPPSVILFNGKVGEGAARLHPVQGWKKEYPDKEGPWPVLPRYVNARQSCCKKLK